VAQFCAYFLVAVAKASPAFRALLGNLLSNPVGPSTAGKYYMVFGDKADYNALVAMAGMDGVVETVVIPDVYKVSAALMDDKDDGYAGEVVVGLTPGFSKRGSSNTLAQVSHAAHHTAARTRDRSGGALNVLVGH
jgi:hypothetical protein